MKRLIPVLAVALILVFFAWDDAASKRYPELRLETVQWDHPWGGEQHNNDNPPFMDSTPSNADELVFLDIVKFWYRNISPTMFYRFRNDSKDITVTPTEIIPGSQPLPETNQVTSQGGSGK